MRKIKRAPKKIHLFWSKQKRRLFNLNMGAVRSCYVLTDKSKITLWAERGYKEYQDFKLFKLNPKENETVVLGIPKTISEFGECNFINTQILDCSPHRGTSGMGGPGFFGLLCNTAKGEFWLTVAFYSSCLYMLLDGTVIECHPDFDNLYNPWYHAFEVGGREKFKSIFTGAKIGDITRVFEAKTRGVCGISAP
jgi:hypothetical protein